jgi:hypothetical protein
MKLEDAMVRSGKAKDVEEARKLVEKLREETGSNEDYYKALFDKYGIAKHRKPKSKRKPKDVRNFKRAVILVTIAIVMVLGAVTCFLHEDVLLGIAIIIIAIVSVIYVNQRVDQINHDETFK